MTDIDVLAARRKTALAARVQLEALAAGRLSRDIARPELLNLGRDLAKACAARAATLEIERAACAAAAEAVAGQSPMRRDLALALAQTLEERRLKGHELIMVGLRLIAPDERRQFVEAAMQRVDELEQRPAVPPA